MNENVVQALYFAGIKLVMMVSDTDQNSRVIFQFDKHRYIYLTVDDGAFQMYHARKGSPVIRAQRGSVQDVIKLYKEWTEDYKNTIHFDDLGNLTSEEVEA